MREMFRYLTGILEKEEQRSWKIYALLSMISPVVDIFSFSVIIYIINIVVAANSASPGLITFTLFMVLVSLLNFHRIYLSGRTEAVHEDLRAADQRGPDGTQPEKRHADADHDPQ